MAMPSV